MKKARMRVICHDDACLTTMRLHSMSLPSLLLASSTFPDLPSLLLVLALWQPLASRPVSSRSTPRRRQRGISHSAGVLQRTTVVRRAMGRRWRRMTAMPPRACCREGRLLGGKKQKTWQPEEDVKKTKTAGAEGRWSFDGLLESLSAPMMTTCTAPGTKTEKNWGQSNRFKVGVTPPSIVIMTQVRNANIDPFLLCELCLFAQSDLQLWFSQISTFRRYSHADA